MNKQILLLLCLCFSLGYPVRQAQAQSNDSTQEVTFRHSLLNLQKLTFKSVEKGVRKIYTHIKFKELTQEHHQVAILPIEITIDKDELYHTPVQEINHRAFVEAQNAYPVIFASLQKEKVFNHYHINFQDISTTRRILAEHNLTPAVLKKMPPNKLAALLGVDAIITCSIVREEKLVAEAKAKDNFRRAKGFVGPSAGTATVHIYDGKNSELLWQFERLLTGNAVNLRKIIGLVFSCYGTCNGVFSFWGNSCRA